MKHIAFLLCALLFAACTSIDGNLWRSRPMEIVVKEELKTKGDVLGSRKIFVPPGTYAFFKATDLGFLYTCEGAAFRSEESVFGMTEKKEFVGGILLFNRTDEVRLVRIISSTESLGKAGELPRYFIGKEIEKNGFASAFCGPALSEDQREALGLPRKYEK
jgi:hypothetical protein